MKRIGFKIMAKQNWKRKPREKNTKPAIKERVDIVLYI